jgi:hypothetical protein
MKKNYASIIIQLIMPTSGGIPQSKQKIELWTKKILLHLGKKYYATN